MTRYSETISDELKDKVTRLQARDMSDFKSCAFEIMEGMGDDLTVCRWLRAQKDEETNDWIVKEYQTAPHHIPDGGISAADLDNVPAKQRTIMHRACFMDALHACASFETLERNKGKFPLGPDKEELAVEHYQNAGEEEGIPFDLNSGLPVPAANGIILSEDSELPALSKDFEKRSKGNLLPKAELPALNAQNLLGEQLDIPEQAIQDTAKHIKTVQRNLSTEHNIRSIHQKQVTHIEKLSEAFKKAQRYDFRYFDMRLENPVVTVIAASPALTWPALFNSIASGGDVFAGAVFGTMFTVASVGLSCLFAVIAKDMIGGEFERKANENRPDSIGDFFRKNGVHLPMRQFNKQLKNIRKDINTLDDENEKARLLHLTDKIELTSYAMRTRCSFNKAAQNGGWLNMRRMANDQKALEKFAQKLGMNRHDINNLITALQKTSGFKSSLKKQFQKDLQTISGSFDEQKAKRLELLPPTKP